MDNLYYDGLLGVDDMKKMGDCKLDFSEGTLQINENKIHLKTELERTENIFMIENCEIDPFSEVEITSRKENKEISGPKLFIPFENTFSRPYLQQENKPSITLINPTENKI